MKKLLFYLSLLGLSFLAESALAQPNITYSPQTNIFIYGTLVNLNPSNTGTVATGWSIDNPLPAGLVFDPSSGNISGTPTAIALATDYTITATDALNNSSTFTINITVSPASLTITATGPPKTYGTALAAGASTINFTAGATAIAGETVTGVTLTPDAQGLATNTAAGTAYVVTPSLATGGGGFLASNYDITYVPFNGTVTAAPLTITATGPLKTYGTALVAGTSTINFTAGATAIAGESVTGVTLTPDAQGLAANTAAGTAYAVTPSAPTGTGGFLATNYSITFNNFNGTVTATPLTITATGPLKTYGTALVAGTSTINFTAGATAIAGETVTGVTLTPDAQGLAANTAAGAAYAVTPSLATGGGGFLAANYNITYTPFNGTVTAAPLTITATGPLKTYGTVLVAGTSTINFTAGATAIAGETVTGVTLTPNAAGLAANTVAGAAYVITPSLATGGGGFLAANYNITYTPFNGTVAAAPLTITATGPSKTYGTALVTGTSTINFTAGATAIAGETVTGVTLTPNAAGLAANTAAGAAYVVTPSLATGGGGFLAANYNLTYSPFNGTVAAKALTVSATGPAKTYGTALPAGPTAANFSAVGAAAGETVTSVTLTPNAAGLSATTAAGAAYVVTPSAPTGTGGFLATNYSITFNNFNGTVAAAPLTITATGPAKTYGTALTAGPTGANFSAVGAVAGQTVTSVTLTPNAAGLSATTAAGAAYVVTPSAPTGTGGFLATNYSITFNNFNGTVTAKALTITATGPAKTYGTALPAGPTGANFSAVGAAAGETVTSVTLTPNAAGLSATTAAGAAYVVTPSAPTGTGGFLATNYSITFNNFNGTVTAAPLTITATGPAKTYGTALPAGPTAANFSAVGAIAGQTVTSVTLTPNAAGLSATTASGAAYVVTPSAPTGSGGFLATNYSITFNNFNGTVAAAPLTITATGPAKTYGTALPAGPSGANFSAVGAVAGQTVTSVTLTPNAAGLSATTAAGAAYVVTPSAPTGSGGFLATNYSITFNNFNGTVAAKALTINATGPAKTYGTALTAGPTGANFSAVGAAAGETVTSVTLTPNAAGLSATTAAGAAYVVTPSAPTGTGGFLATNYSITFNNFNGTVTAKALTVTAIDVTKNYGVLLTGGAGSTAFTSVGLVGAETIGSVRITYGTGSAANASVAGSPYNGSVTPSAATGGTFNASNYTITYVSGSITISPVALTITANNFTKNFGVTIAGGTGSAAFTSTVLQNGETIGSVTIAYGAAAAGSAAIGTYTNQVTPSAATGGTFTVSNYTISYISATLTVTAAGANAYDWTGVAGTVWENPLNWEINNVQQTAIYPGSSSNTDIANIGVNTAIPVITNYPVMSAANLTIASLTFGNNNAPVNNTGGTLQLTVNGFNLTITGAILQMHSATGGTTFGATTNGITTTLLGTGTITCGSFTVGDNTLPTNFVGSITRVNIGSNATSTLSVIVNGNFTINSSSLGFFIGLNISDAYVSLGAGTLTVNGTMQLTNNIAGFSFIGSLPYAQFSIDLNNTNAPVLNLQGTTALNIAVNTGLVNNKVDFFNPTVNPHKAGTVNYTGASQKIYNFAATGMNALIDNSGQTANDGYVYQNLGFSGTGTKTLDAGAFDVAGTFILAAGAETVALNTNNPVLTVGSNFSTGVGSTFTNGTGAVTIGGNFNNDGTCSFGAPLLTFNSAAAATFTATQPVLFTNVAFSGGGTKNMTSGTYNVGNTGVLTMSGNTQLGAGGFLTLNSTAAGSATVAAIPTGSSITGNVNVQRFITGGTGYRGYRLLSSPVYGTTVSLINRFSVNYLQNSCFVKGTSGTAGGFDATGNPSIFLFREDIVGSNITFLTSNYRGLNTLGTAPNFSYFIDIDGGPYTIPAGDGFLFFFRGDRNAVGQTLSSESVATYVPTNTTLTATGTLNQGPIKAIDWYNISGSTSLGYTASATPFVQGFNLIGNPYASSINWDTYSTTVATAGVYAPNVGPFAYVLDPISQNFSVYKSGTGGVGNLNANKIAANIIPSGHGFFVIASNTSAQLTFNETSKVNTQATTAIGNLLLGTPAQANIPQYLHLILIKDTISTDGTLIDFNSTGKSTYDPTEDAIYKLGNGAVSLSSISADNVGLAINTLPLPNQAPLSIPLNVVAYTNATYQLNLTSVNHIPELYNIWLADAYTKDTIDIRNNRIYSFNILTSDPASYGSKRFTLIIRQNPSLALQLLNFTATKVSTGSQIIWKTKNEANYTYFTVERSTDDGKTFNIISSVASSGLGTYSIVDKSPVLSAADKYRLKLEDLNGTISYSPVVTLMYGNLLNAGNLISIYPNPAKNDLNLSIIQGSDSHAVPNTVYGIKIVNSTGTVVKTVTTTQQKWQADISGFTPGIYFVQVINNKDRSEVGRSTFVKL